MEVRGRREQESNSEGAGEGRVFYTEKTPEQKSSSQVNVWFMTKRHMYMKTDKKRSIAI